MLTRRTLLKGTAGVGLITSLPSCGRENSQPAPATGALLNHVGFTPNAGKFCLIRGGPKPFEIVDAKTAEVAHKGTLASKAGDLGEFSVGDFTAFTKPGSYLLRIPNVPAEPFTIAPDVYAPAIRACIGYFAKQRCGD